MLVVQENADGIKQLQAEKKNVETSLKDLKIEFERVAHLLMTRFPDKFGKFKADPEEAQSQSVVKKSFDQQKIALNPEATEEQKKTAQLFWRELVSTCHPDKTDDTVKHDIFLRAKEARDVGDTEAFVMIYFELQEYKKSNSLLNRLLYRERLLSRIAAVKKDIAELQSKPFYILVQVYRKDPEAAVILYEQSVGA